MRVLVLLALVGCYSPGYRDCEVTCGGGSCPSGFVCDQGVCRIEGFSGACGATTTDDAKIIDSPPEADDDGDRVLNKDDNCPTVSNPTQNNEDQDARGDACDPCPVDDSPGADDDDDQDGVGNGCDPEPGMVNRMDVFEGFNGSGPPVGATVTGTWSYSGGQARSAASGANTAMTAWAGATTDTEMVSAHFTITSFDPTAGSGFVGVAHQLGTSSAVRCSLEPNPGSLALVSGTGRYGSVGLPVAVNTTAVTVSTRTAGSAVAPAPGTGNYDCRDAVTGTNFSAVVSTDASAVGQTGFYSYGIGVTLDWIVIVSRAP